MKKPVILLLCIVLCASLFMAMPTGGEVTDPVIRQSAMWTKRPPATSTPFVGIIMEMIPLVTATPFRAPSKTVLPAATTPIPLVDESLDNRSVPLATKTPTPAPERTGKPSTPTPAPESAEGGLVFTSFGLYWREVLPRVTEEWFMVTPLDLSAEGEQIYPLVASGALIVGQVRVTVAGGTVRVDCEIAEGVQVLSEFLTFFPDLDSVKTISLPLLSRQNYPFRSPLSVRSTFGEDRLVLMYINNGIAFDPALPGLSRFDEELYRPWMLDMLTLLD